MGVILLLEKRSPSTFYYAGGDKKYLATFKTNQLALLLKEYPRIYSSGPIFNGEGGLCLWSWGECKI